MADTDQTHVARQSGGISSFVGRDWAGGQTGLHEGFQGLGRIKTQADDPISAGALLCLLYFTRSVVESDRARKDGTGDMARIKSPDLTEYA